MMTKGPFPFIAAEGSPYDCGWQHGSQAKDRITRSLATYREMFWNYAGLGWEDALARALQYIPNVEKYDPAIMEEIRGVADGAGRPVSEIMALNARSELALTSKMLPGCTALAVTPEATATGTTFIGQNWDWKASQREAMIILQIKQEDRPSILMVTEAGIVGKIGFNSAGVAVCLNALVADQNGPGTPLHVVLRGILNAETLGDAVAAVARTPIASAANFLIAHRDGEAFDIEAAPADFTVLPAVNGMITHTNHFTSLPLAGFKDIGKFAFADPPIRLGRVNNLLNRQRGQLDLPGIQAVLRDHFNHPNAICRHENPRDEVGRRVESVFSIIMDLNAWSMHLTAGPPCSSEYISCIADF